MKRLGYAGGLKSIERQIGLDRGDLRSVDGFLTVALWQEYKRRKSETALETLLAYNCADVINLEQMMVMAYNLNINETPFGRERQLTVPEPAKIPFKADSKLVARLAW